VHERPPWELATPQYCLSPTRALESRRFPSDMAMSIAQHNHFDPYADEHGPFPSGWERGKHPDSGRTYYIDHNTRSTTWVRPPSSTPGVHSVHTLPPGWEERYTDKGRRYYVDHNARVTTFAPPPQSPPSSTAVTTLPPNWEERFTDGGRRIYVNRMTERTTWTRPQSSVTLPPGQEELKTRTTPSSAVTPTLLPNWEERFTDIRIRYYVDHNTRTTTWDRPAMAELAEPGREI